uniref:Developmental pluripotency-associated protein 4-like n=1 Tax=Castor canadensis TaxID=51338 RepID=A0A8B7UIN5_CASCN|nr:developmental pluripotency-associated protein 4-like [Castor canadensis]
MENARGKEWSCSEKSKEEEEQGPAQPSTSSTKATAKGKKQAKPVGNDKGSCSKEPKKIPIPPLPSELPPVNLIHRDILRAWCQQLKLSSKGQKLEAYKRLCEHAYPQQKHCLQNIPSSAKEARMKTPGQRKSKAGQGEPSQKSPPPEVAPVPEEQLSVLEDPPVLYEEVSTTVVTTSAPEAVLASWGRIAANAGNKEAQETELPRVAYGDKWCVVHGRSLPANTDGWVQLQFHAGQAWVPENKGKVSALFLLPACTFLPPNLEDNMLCPKCVHRNKVLIKSLQ